MALLEEVDFLARWEAALALRKEKDAHASHTGTAHLKHPKRVSAKKNPADQTMTVPPTNEVDNDEDEEEDAMEEKVDSTTIPTIPTTAESLGGKQLPVKR